MDLCEFKASLVYRASARTGSKATQRNPVSKNKTKQQKTKKKRKKASYSDFIMPSGCGQVPVAKVKHH